ncbi:MAG TPA: serine/threonine-protein kinase, partial [Gemmataceae bacterium]|nr:serine/threonine-protein kinase [Gemmataceae bacterium]
MGHHPGRPAGETLLDAQRRRWAAGDRVPVEHFLDGRPAVAGDTELVLDLIYAEVLLRREAGEQPTADEYLARFPDLADPIKTQFEVDAALEGGVTRTGGRSRSVGRPAGGPTSPTPPAPPGFEIIEELGRGGMGVVYKARQKALHRLVALKVIRSGELADPAERARFEAEARAVARLSHPNVVQIYEVGEAGGRPFLALEYVPGGSLADHLHGPPFAPRPAAALVATVAGAVQHAHDAGIVHRDLKPANILLPGVRGQGSGVSGAHDQVLTPDSWLLTPKLSDFGLAKHLGADSLTRTGDFLGTPNYAAPEQAAGRPDVGPAADVYALGAILYHLVTGHPPFAGSTPVETLDLVRFADPVPPSRLRPNLPRDLGTIILTCLNKDPARRYPTAQALAEDLTRYLGGESIRARPAGTVERAARWARRRPAVAGLLAFVLVLGLASLLTVTALWRRAAAARDAEATARADERAEREQTEARSAELLIANARYAWMTDDVDAARRALDECPADRRSVDWEKLHRACTAGRLIVPPSNTPLDCIAFGPDGRLVAGGGLGSRVLVWEAATGREVLKTFLMDHSVQAIALTADSRVVAFTHTSPAKNSVERLTHGAVAIIDLATGAAKTAWTRPDRPSRFALSPDGRRAVCVSPQSKIAVVLDIPSGQVRHQIECQTGIMMRVAFSPDGHYLVTAGLPKELAVWDMESGALVHQFPCPETFFGFNAVAVSGEGRRVAVGVGPGAGPPEVVLFRPGAEPRRIV